MYNSVFNSGFIPDDSQTKNNETTDHTEISRFRSMAENIVHLARKKGEGIIEEAHKEAQRIKNQAQEEGFRKGYGEGIVQGEERGLEEFRSRTGEIIDNLLEGEKEYEQHLNKLLTSLEPRMIDMLLVVIKAILKKEIEQDDELVIRTIREAARNLTRRDKILLTAHRSEVERIANQARNLIQSSDMMLDIEVVPGEQVGKGGIIISSAEGIIDARIESQMEVISDIVNS